MKTWKLEMAGVAAILLAVNFFTHKILSIELLASMAVLLTFGHAQIADRLAEQEGLKKVPAVSCYKKMWYYFMAKEFFWLLYFFMNKSYSALIGVFVFLAYPVWRSWYRRMKPINDQK